MVLVGCGSWGKHILRDLVEAGCEVTVVARSPESVERARVGKADRIVPRLRHAEEPDGLVVAVPTSLHAEVLDQATQFGKPIFVEKPITNDPETAARFADSETIFVMDKWRYHPGITTMRELIGTGEFGPLRGIHTTRHSVFNPHHDVDAIWVLAPHDLSIVLEFMGELPPAVAAQGEVAGVEARLTGFLGSGVSIDVSSRSHVFRREVRLTFDEAVVALTDGYARDLEVLLTRGGSEPDRRQIPIADHLPLAAELHAFIAYLFGGPAPKSSAAEGVSIVNRLQELRYLAGLDR